MSLADELARIARRKLLSQITTTDRLVRMQYIRAANDIAKEIRTAKRGSLTERWLISYKRELDKEIERLGRNIYGAVTDGAQAAAEARAEATAEYLRRAAAQARVDDSFVSTLSSVPTDALRAMIDGKLYADGRMLSSRIWSATGRLEGNISQILQQGVAQQMDALTLARHLEAYVNPEAACPVSWHKIYPDIPFDRKIDYNALRLARTTLTHAHWLAGREAARKNPLCRGMKWHLSDQHYERQIAVAGEDVCDEYARHDEGLGRGVWSIDRLPLPHPQCLCYQTEELPGLEEAADFLGAWVRGEQADAAMESGFQKWQKENAAELNNWYAEGRTRLSGRQSFTNNDVARAASLANADIPAEIISGIESVYRRIAGDFPALDAMAGRFRFEDESGGGAFGYMYRPDGMMEASILLDRDIFASAQSLKAYFERHLAEGHTRNASDPMFIVSHELGHALHTAAAARELGISLDKPITHAQYELIKAKRDELAVDVYLHVDVFEGEEYDTFEAIAQAVDKEMGWRGTYDGIEFIAQSVAMVYNGDGAHPIADAVVRYLKEKLR